MAQKTLRERLAATGNEDEEGTDGDEGEEEAAPKKRKAKPEASSARTTGPRKNVAKGKEPAGEPLYLSTEPSPGAIEIPIAAPLHKRASRFLDAILSDD